MGWDWVGTCVSFLGSLRGAQGSLWSLDPTVWSASFLKLKYPMIDDCRRALPCIPLVRPYRAKAASTKALPRLASRSLVSVLPNHVPPE